LASFIAQPTFEDFISVLQSLPQKDELGGFREQLKNCVNDAIDNGEQSIDSTDGKFFLTPELNEILEE
jgi:hypothetical protein